jgi:hypothetical protein
MATRDLRVELAGVASGTLSTLQEMGAVIASAAVGALLQNRLAATLHAQAVAAATRLPARVAPSFVASFSGSAASGLQIGAGQSGAELHIPAGTPPSLTASLESLAHSVFAEGFVAAMKPTMLLPIGVLVLAAVASLFARGHPRGGHAELTESAAGTAGTSAEQKPLIRQGEKV